MTTPRDDIAGLSERLRFDAVRCELQFSKGVASNIEEAATQLDSLLKERDAQAILVQELQYALMYWMPGVSEAIENETNGRCGDDADLLAGYEGKIPSECWGDKVLARLDSLLKEREELQARVKELEREVETSQRHEQTLRDNGIASHSEAVVRVVDAESRALRAEQERDEAYERAAQIAIDVCNTQADGWQRNPGADRSGEIAASNCGVYAAQAIRRLASGPEKEDKE